MEERLTEYMKSFTRPLVVNVFGATNDNIKSSGQIINMFSNIDRDVALKNMRKIANMMGITISDIPDFLEKYGDKIGRASCGERGCKYVSIPGVAVSLKKKKK